MSTRVGYSRGTWEPGSQEILEPQAKYLALKKYTNEEIKLGINEEIGSF